MKSTKKWLSVLLTVVCLFSLLVGCGTQTTQQDEQGTTRTVVDMAGRTVEIPEKVNSYIALWIGSVDIVMMLDKGEHMVGCSDTATSYSMFEQVCNNSQELTFFKSDAVTKEGILETGADVVFYRGADHAELADKLTQAGVAAVDVEFNTYDEMMSAIDIMASVLNTDYAKEKSEGYKIFAREMIEKTQKIGNSVQERKSVIVIRDTSDFRTYGKNRFAGRWVTLCGGDYALKEGDPDGYVNLTDEQLLEYDPEFIIFVMPGEAKKFLEDTRWSALTAVEKGQVFENPSVIGTWSNHGAECMLQFEWAISKIYPELADFDIKEDVKSFYKEFYGIELNDDEISNIINAG